MAKKLENKPKILVVGSINMDLICKTKCIPNEGETIIGEDFSTAPGGKGANQAVQMARLGADVTMVGCVGCDAFAEALIGSLKDAGVNTDYIIKKQGISSGCAQIILDVNQEKAANRILVFPQANRAMEPNDIAFLKDMMQDFDMVLLQHEIDMEINLFVARLAHQKGVKVMLNPAPAAEIPQEMAGLITYISPNEHEAYTFTGVKISKANAIEDAKKAAQALIDSGFKQVLITLGAQGCLYANGNKFHHAPCIDLVKVVDSTAAGDSFVGAFSAQVCKGESIEQAMLFASYTATITVSRKGAQPSLPTLEEVEAFINHASKSPN